MRMTELSWRGSLTNEAATVTPGDQRCAGGRLCSRDHAVF